MDAKKAGNLIYSHGYSSENLIVNETIKCINVLENENSDSHEVPVEKKSYNDTMSATT